MGHAYSPEEAFGGISGRTAAQPKAARLSVIAKDPFKEKAERDAARRAAHRGQASKEKTLAVGGRSEGVEGKLRFGPALRVVASGETPPVEKVRKPAKKPPLALVTSLGAGEPTVTEAEFTELPKEPTVERTYKASRSGGGGPPHDRFFSQDDLAGVLIVLALLLLIALYLVRGDAGVVAPSPQHLVAPQIAANQPPPAAPLVDPFGDKPVDLTPKSPPPSPAAAAIPAPPPACPPGRMMHAWFCTAKSELSPAARASLEKEFAEWGSCVVGKALLVTGYADTRGQPDYNNTLSSARAAAVADVLRGKGATVAEATGKGELPDLVDNKNCANQRRVDVRLSDDPEAPPPSKSCKPLPEQYVPPSCG